MENHAYVLIHKIPTGYAIEINGEKHYCTSRYDVISKIGDFIQFEMENINDGI